MKKENAFTFIELMLVVVIIGVIALFVVPGYERAQDRALEQKALANLKQIYSAQKVYYSKNGEYWGPGAGGDTPISEPDLGVSLPDDELSYYCRGCQGINCQNFFCFAKRDHTNNNRDFYYRIDGARIKELKDGCDGTTYKKACNPGCADYIAGANACPTVESSRSDYNVFSWAAWNS